MPMADMTITNAVNKEPQSKTPTTSSSYENRVYKRRLTGNVKTESRVDIAVIVTERAKSALNNEHHQFEYDPPGELVTTSKVIPIA
mmetsp:Transcript_21602/g.31750  ORF Transcript_21602/g.31750 Transcript_21602/m.31750 type:complete len:86 (+) Transcript_21602:1169-1426(+)